MINTCTCSVGLGNTGTPNCEEIMKVAKGIIIVPTFKDDGTRNKLDLSTPILQATIDAFINNDNADERWYPLPGLENVENVRAEAITEAANSGVTFFVQEGPKTFLAMLFNQGPVLLGKLQQMNCNKVSAFIIDKGDNLIGVQDGTDLFPIRIQDNTFYPQLVDATDTTVQKIATSWTWDNTENDADLRMVVPGESGGVSWLGLDGLQDVNVVYTSISTTGFVATLTTDYGTAVTKQPVPGLVIGDFTLAEISPTPGPIVITTVTEGADGVYTFVIPPATSADVLRLTPDKDSFDFSNVIETDIIIP